MADTSPVRRALGRRGLVLALYGVIFVVIGVKSLLDPAEDAGRLILYAFLPAEVRAGIWIIPAILAIVASFRPGGRDGYGFVALSVPTTIVSFSYAWSFVGYVLGVQDWPFGWLSMTTWALLLAQILVVSGWSEGPVRPPRLRGRHKGAPPS